MPHIVRIICMKTRMAMQGGDVCCNESCGICTAPMDPCTQQECIDGEEEEVLEEEEDELEEEEEKLEATLEKVCARVFRLLNEVPGSGLILFLPCHSSHRQSRSPTRMARDF